MEVRTSGVSSSKVDTSAGLGVFATRTYTVGELICQEDAPLLRLAPVDDAQDEALRTALLGRRRKQALSTAAVSAAAAATCYRRHRKGIWQTIKVPLSIPDAYRGTFKGMVQAALCWTVLYQQHDTPQQQTYRSAQQELVLQLYIPNLQSPSKAETSIIDVAQQALQYLEQHDIVGCTANADKDTLLRVMLVWTCNAFAQGRVYHTMSRVNHSCNPNAVVQPLYEDTNHYNQNDNDGQRLVAASPINVGDEICISYAGLWLYAERSVRQAHLLQTKHFDCRCTRCSATQDRAASVPCFDCHPRSGRQLDEDAQYDDDQTVRYTVPQHNQLQDNSNDLVYPCPVSGKPCKTTSVAAHQAGAQVVQKTVAFLQDYERREQQQQQKEDRDGIAQSVVASARSSPLVVAEPSKVAKIVPPQPVNPPPAQSLAPSPTPPQQQTSPPQQHLLAKEDDSSSEEDAFANLATQKTSSQKIEQTTFQHQPQSKQHKRPQQEEDDDSSSDEDVFSNLAKKKPRSDSKDVSVPSSAPSQTAPQPPENPNLPATITSSMKRHHKEMSGSRKAKMDALLQELEAVPVHKKDIPTQSLQSLPYVKGSYVPPNEEYTTTNLFVGNLSPSLTEPQITNLFGSFGELYSVKIMWPRTPQDHARGRLTAFICYWTREDAERAMAQCHDADVFGNGRRLVIRWGKDVTKKGISPALPPQGDHPSQKSVPQITAPAAGEKITTGRQLERLRYGGPDGSASLSPSDLDQFHQLTIHKLTLSRESICQAMAFCFEKSASAKQIAKLLKNLLLDSTNMAVETRIARLYLLSDILFNSQQPGIRNAFLYRNAIEAYSPEIFTHLGKTGMGRIAKSKMETAVSRVLSAWTAWSVYAPIFIDQLHDLFHGKEIKIVEEKTETDVKSKTDEQPGRPNDATTDVIPANDAALVKTTRLSNWAEVNHEEEQKALRKRKSTKSVKVAKRNGPAEEGEVIASDQDSGELETYEDADGESMDVDGESVDVDGEPVEEDVDGEPVDEDVDGEPADEDIDGEPVNEDLDGEPVDLDGEPVDENIDGESVQDADGEQTNGEKITELKETSDNVQEDPNGIPLDDDDDEEDNEEDDDEEDIDDEEEEALLDEMLDQHIRMASSVMGARHWTTNLLLLLQVDRSLQSLHGAMLVDGNSKAPATDLEALAATIDSLERVVRFAQALNDEVSLHIGHLVSDVVIGLARVLVALGDPQSQKYAADWLDKIAVDYVHKFAPPVVQKVVANLHTAWQRQPMKPHPTGKDNRKPPSKKRRR